MSPRTLNFFSASFFFIAATIVLIISGCGGVTTQAGLRPAPTPPPAPSPTPESFSPNHVLLKGGLNGEIHREFTVTGSGLQQIGGDITLPIQDRLGPPAMASAGGILFALDSNPASAVLDAFHFDPAVGTFSLASQTSLQTGVGTFSVDPFGNFLYVNQAHDDPPDSYESNLNAFRIAPDTSPAQISGAPFIFSGGPTSGAGCCVTLGSSLAITPDGTKAYATEELTCPCHSGPSAIWVVASFLRDPTTRAISKNNVQQGSVPSSENFMQGVVVVKNGKFLVFASIDGLMAYSIDASTGFLTKLPAPSPLPPTDLDHVYLDISATRDGDFVYVDQPLSGLLYGFHVDDNGSLTPVPGSPYNLAGADLVTVSNTDNFVFVVSLPDLLAFKRDANTGALAPFGSVSLNIPVHALINLN